ncbi:hypothetical protein Tco_1468042 [Tanacetum coccineum]
MIAYHGILILEDLIDKGALSRSTLRVIRDMLHGAKTAGIQEDIHGCMIFADDIVLVSESAEGLNDRLENWREALEANDLRLRMLGGPVVKTIDLDRIPNGVYREELEVETIINKMRKGRLRWFGHVRRRPQSAPVRRVEALVVDGMRRRGLEPKLRWRIEALLASGLLVLCLFFSFCLAFAC